MKDQKISMKLSIAFGTILALLVICIIFGAFSLNSVAQNLNEF